MPKGFQNIFNTFELELSGWKQYFRRIGEIIRSRKDSQLSVSGFQLLIDVEVRKHGERIGLETQVVYAVNDVNYSNKF